MCTRKVRGARHYDVTKNTLHAQRVFDVCVHAEGLDAYSISTPCGCFASFRPSLVKHLTRASSPSSHYNTIIAQCSVALCSFVLCTLRDSNPRHPRCKRGALPTELSVQIISTVQMYFLLSFAPTGSNSRASLGGNEKLYLAMSNSVQIYHSCSASMHLQEFYHTIVSQKKQKICPPGRNRTYIPGLEHPCSIH
jgi:hypothetical protein